MNSAVRLFARSKQAYASGEGYAQFDVVSFVILLFAGSEKALQENYREAYRSHRQQVDPQLQAFSFIGLSSNISFEASSSFVVFVCIEDVIHTSPLSVFYHFWLYLPYLASPYPSLPHLTSPYLTLGQ